MRTWVPVTLTILLLSASVVVLAVTQSRLAADLRAGQATPRSSSSLARDLYRAQIQAAALALRCGDIAQADDFLNAAPDAARGFEWRHLALRRRRLLQHTPVGERFVTALALSADGRWLASAGQEGSFQLLDLADGTLRELAFGVEGPITALAFSVNGLRLACGTEGGQIEVCDLREAQRKLSLPAHESAITAVVFGAEDAQLLSSSMDESVRVWDLETGESRAVWRGHEGAVFDVACRGDVVVFAGMLGDVRVASLSSAKEVATYPVHDDWVRSVALRADGSVAASGSDDETVRLFDPSTGEILGVLEHDSAVRWVAFDQATPPRLYTATESGTLRVFRGATAEVLRLPLARDEPPRLVALDQSGSTLAFVTTVSSGVWRRHGEGLRHDIDLGFRDVRSLAMDERGTALAVVTDEGSLLLFDAERGALRWECASGNESAGVVALNTRAGLVATGGSDRQVHCYSLATGEPERVLEGMTAPVDAVALNAEGTAALAVGRDGSFLRWDLSSGAVLVRKPGPRAGVFEVGCTGEAGLVFWSSDGGTFRAWDATTGEKVAGLREPELGMISSLCVAPDEGRAVLVSGSTTASGFEWGGSRLSWSHTAPNQDRIEHVAFDPRGSCVAVGTFAGIVYLIDEETGKTLLQLGERGPPVRVLRFSGDGKRLCVGHEGRVTIWETEARSLHAWEAGS